MTANTPYSFVVRGRDAAGNVSGQSNTVQVQTLTPSIIYCAAQGNNASEEFIKRFTLNTINNTSTGQSYSDFTIISTTLAKSQSYDVTIVPTWPGSVFNEAYGVWIDYNRDGTFDEVTERILTQAPTQTTPITTNFSVPTSANEGATRMRVVMRYNVAAQSCGTFDFGEVEDYTVNIVSGNATITSNQPLKNDERVSMYPKPAIDKVQIDLGREVPSKTRVEIFDNLGRTIKNAKISNNQSIDVSNFPSGLYFITIKMEKQIIQKNISETLVSLLLNFFEVKKTGLSTGFLMS